MTQIFHNGRPIHGCDSKTLKVITSTLPIGTLGSVASLLAATLYQGNPDRNYKLWNIVSTVRYIVGMIVHMQVLLEMLLHINGKVEIVFCRKVSFLTTPYCQSMKQAYLYLWYPLFEAQ